MYIYRVVVIAVCSGICSCLWISQQLNLCDVDPPTLPSGLASSPFATCVIGNLVTGTDTISFDSSFDIFNEFKIIRRSGDFYLLRSLAAENPDVYLCTRITHHADNYYSLIFFGPQSSSSPSPPYRYADGDGVADPELCDVCSNGADPAPTAEDIIVLQKTSSADEEYGQDPENFPELGCMIPPCCDGEGGSACNPQPTGPNLLEFCGKIVERADILSGASQPAHKGRSITRRRKGKGKADKGGKTKNSKSDDSSNSSSEEECECSGRDALKEFVTDILNECDDVIGDNQEL